MSSDVLSALIPKGCEPPKVPIQITVGEGLKMPPVTVEARPLSFEELKQRLTGLPVSQYPVLLALLVKGAWACQVFEDGKIGEFVKNLEAGFSACIVKTKPPELMVAFGLKAQQLLEDIHSKEQAGHALDAPERTFYMLAGEELRLKSALKEFQYDHASGGGESGESKGTAGPCVKAEGTGKDPLRSG